MKSENNFLTYLEWRGDMSVEVCPFNEIDALILTELVYVRFEDVVPKVGEKGEITICRANEKYVRKSQRELPDYRRKEELLEVLAKCPRFADMTLCNYESTMDIAEHKQFAAMHINISKAQTFIAFRGTDSTLVGWREDFNMSFMMPVPAQEAAVDYVNKTMRGLFKRYLFGGHSKGGNLAIYSAVFCKSLLQNKIETVYSFDGPGFSRKVVNDAAYKRIADRIEAFVPVASIIGMLMEHAENYKVVESKEKVLMQHEGFSWEVYRDGFVLVDDFEPFTKKLGSALKNWLDGMSSSDRKALVDELFRVFENAGIQDLTD